MFGVGSYGDIGYGASASSGTWEAYLYGGFLDDGQRKFAHPSDTSWAVGAVSQVAYPGDVSVETTWNGDQYEVIGLDTVQRGNEFYASPYLWMPETPLLKILSNGSHVMNAISLSSLTAGVSKYGIQRMGSTVQFWVAPDGVTKQLMREVTGVTDPLYITAGSYLSGSFVGPVENKGTVWLTLSTLIYLGARAWSSIYRSSRSEASIYRGVRTLHG